jgi:hypothetical protein
MITPRTEERTSRILVDLRIYPEASHIWRFATHLASLNFLDPTSRSWKIYRVEILADGQTREEDGWFSKGLILLS